MIRILCANCGFSMSEHWSKKRADKKFLLYYGGWDSCPKCGGIKWSTRWRE